MYVFVFIRVSHVVGTFSSLKSHIHVRESWHAYEGVKLCMYVFAFIYGKHVTHISLIGIQMLAYDNVTLRKCVYICRVAKTHRMP